MTDTPVVKLTHKAIYIAVRQFILNEVLGGGAGAARKWLQDHVKETLGHAFRGNHEQIIRKAVREVLNEKMGSFHRDAFREMVERVVRDEVRAIVGNNLKVEASLSLDINPKRYENEAQF